MTLVILVSAFIFFFLLSEKIFDVVKYWVEKYRIHFLNSRHLGSIVFTMLKPIIVILSKRISSLKIEKYRKLISKSIADSNLSADLTPDEVISFQIVLSVILAVVKIYLLPVGLIYPVIWLKKIARNRKKNIEMELPDLIDRLSLSISAGLDMVSAVKRIVLFSEESFLSKELKLFLNELELGALKNDAMKNLSTRCGVQSVASFVSLLAQSERLGVPVGSFLKLHSSRERQERVIRAEKAGIYASQKVIIPIVFFMIPSVFIVIFGPLLINFINGNLLGSL